MINKTKSPIWLSIGKQFMGIIAMVALSTTHILAQGQPEKKIIVQGSWSYQQAQFKGSKTRSSNSNSAYKNVKLVVSNSKDSIKSIEAKRVYQNSSDNKWYFENGKVSSYNKWGAGKTESFDNLEVVASAFSSGNKK